MAAQLARRTVLLRHELPDGASHIDWMLAGDEAGTAPLMTFRLPARLDEVAIGRRLLAKQIGEHRPEYLSYEGPLSGERGHVTRVASGWIRRWEQRDEAPAPGWDLLVEWEGEAGERLQRLRVIRRDESSWWVISIPQES